MYLRTETRKVLLRRTRLRTLLLEEVKSSPDCLHTLAGLCKSRRAFHNDTVKTRDYPDRSAARSAPVGLEARGGDEVRRLGVARDLFVPEVQYIEELGHVGFGGAGTPSSLRRPT